MKLDQLAKITPVAVSGMTVRQFFEICLEYEIPGIPFADSSGQIIGRLSLRHIVKTNFIPQYASHVAHLMGDEDKPHMLNDEHVESCLQLDVDDFVLLDVPSQHSISPLFAAMARMEKYNTSYLFVIDDMQYLGLVTRFDVVKALLG